LCVCLCLIERLLVLIMTEMLHEWYINSVHLDALRTWGRNTPVSGHAHRVITSEMITTRTDAGWTALCILWITYFELNWWIESFIKSFIPMYSICVFCMLCVVRRVCWIVKINLNYKYRELIVIYFVTNYLVIVVLFSVQH
jgi:hypothetical protein